MLRRFIVITGWLGLIVGLVLQLWVKDRFLPLASVFYAMPKPCLAALALVVAWFSTGGARRRALAACIGITLWWLGSSWSFAPTQTPASGQTKGAITLLYWNLCRPEGVDPHAVELVNELQPDIVAFVEPGKRAGEVVTDYQAQLAGYQVDYMPRGILWMTRTASRYRDRGKLDGLGAYARFDVHGLGPTFPVVVADVYPFPFSPRGMQLHEVLGHALERTDAILVGDFNTPLESTFFEPYRQRFTHALEAGATGLRETWPCGLPLLSLDQVWLGPDWQILEARKIWQLTGSDHAAVWVRFQRR